MLFFTPAHIDHYHAAHASVDSLALIDSNVDGVTYGLAITDAACITCSLGASVVRRGPGASALRDAGRTASGVAPGAGLCAGYDCTDAVFDPAVAGVTGGASCSRSGVACGPLVTSLGHLRWLCHACDGGRRGSTEPQRSEAPTTRTQAGPRFLSRDGGYVGRGCGRALPLPHLDEPRPAVAASLTDSSSLRSGAALC